jgi:predicted nucleic acid-binding protein
LVLDALANIRHRLPGYSLLIPPTVSEELAWLATHAEETPVRESSHEFLRRHRVWGFQLLHAVPLGEMYVAKIAGHLLQRGLLPSSEANDAHILAESAVLGCSVLLTSDEHLRAIDFQRLSFELSPFEVTTPIIATPREIVRKFFRS